MSTSRTFVKPDVAVRLIGLFRLEASREVRGLVTGSAHQHAVVVDLVAENHFLNDQRQVGQLGLEGDFRVRVQDVAFDITIGNEHLLL